MKLLAFAFFAGPLAFLIDQGLGYPLVKPACAADARMLLVGISAFALVVAGAGVVAGRARLAERPLVATVAIGLNLLVAGFIVFAAIPQFVLSPCE